MSLLNVGARALLTNQIALQTTGNNIANVSTPGYSRQSAHLVTVPGQYSPQGYIGKGVAVETILRNHSELLTRQATAASAVDAGDTARMDRLRQLQDVFSGGAVNGYGPARGQRIDTARVIGVVMRNQNRRERKFPCFKKLDNGRAIARINHDALAVAH